MTIPRLAASQSHLPSALPPLDRLLFLMLLGVVVAAGAVSPAAAGASHAEKPKEKPYALIFGTVWGPDNYPLYGVKVEICRADKKKPHWQLYSDHNGEFAQRVPPGPADYLVSADLKGYKYRDGKHLRLDQPVHVHIENDERADVGVHLTE